jgi:predicted Zn-dependent protease
MAFALYLEGNFEEAERVTAAGLSAPHPHPYLYYLDAAILLKLQSKEYDRMVQELALAGRAIPACTLCYLAQSKVHQALGDPQAAVADLETAVRMDPEFSEAWYRLGSLYEQAGRHADAARARTQFRAIKAEKSSRETEILRNMFLETLASPQ